MDISVVIPFHEHEASSGDVPCRLARVLDSLDRTLPRPAEVICVDDNSPVSCEPLVREHQARYLRTPSCPREPHVARRALARQIGLMHARHEAVLFLDADILVPPGLIGDVLEAMRQRGPRAIVFAPRRDVSDEGVRSSEQISENRSQPLQAYMGYALGAFQQPKWASQSSHCFAVAREFVLAVGGWDVNFVGWGEEDTELFYRLWRMGGEVISLHNVIVDHLVHAVDHEANHDSFSRNARYFIAKHPDVAHERREFYRYFGIVDHD